MDRWKGRDALLLFRSYLTEKGILSQMAEAEMEARAQGEIDDAVRFAESAPYPEIPEASRPIYVEDIRHG